MANLKYSIIDKYSDKNFNYSIKHIFDYISNVKDKINRVDRMLSASETQKRDIINQNLHIVTPAEDDFYCKEIQEIISKIK